MKSFHPFVLARTAAQTRPDAGLARCGRGALLSVALPVLLLAGCLGLASAACAQVAEDADSGGIRLSAGGTISAYELGYGEVKKLGGSAFVDADTLRHFGVEGEARWLTFSLQPTGPGPAVDEHATTYMAGLRYSRYYRRFQPYAKGMVGIGLFNFPYNLGRDSCLVAAPGGGVDFRLTKRISWRAVDFEYQFWPKFYYGQMTSYGLSSGIRIKIF